MPRPIRLLTDLYPYHITTHLVDELLFTFEELDMCQEHLRETKEKFNIQVISYNFMQTHYHLILQTIQEDLHKAMQFFNNGLSRKYNRAHKRKGHVWRRRYYDQLIESDEQLLICMRYVERNAINAGVANDVNGWFWNSFQEYEKIGSELVTYPGIYKLLGSSQAERQLRYRGMVETPIPSDKVPKFMKRK